MTGSDDRAERVERNLYQATRAHLAFLRMTAAAELLLPGLLDTAHREQHSATRVIHDLLAVEAAAVAQRRHASLARFAKLPASWTSPTSTSTPNHRLTPPWSKTSPPCGSEPAGIVGGSLPWKRG